MEKSLSNCPYELSLEQLMQTSVGAKIQQAIEIIHNIQNHYFAIIEKQDELDVLGIRTATVMVFAVLRKIAEGKRPCSFDSDDWKDITVSISKNAILELELRMGLKPLSKTKATYLRRLGSSIVCAIAAQNRGVVKNLSAC